MFPGNEIPVRRCNCVAVRLDKAAACFASSSPSAFLRTAFYPAFGRIGSAVIRRRTLRPAGEFCYTDATMLLRRVILSTCVMALALAWAFAAQKTPAPSPAGRTQGSTPASFIPFADAGPILEAYAEDLPAELRGKPAEQLAAAWPGWVAERDAAIRARLEQGDWDTIAHWLVFGASFTQRIRLTPENVQHLKTPGANDAASELLQGRLDDLLNALTSSTQSERILFARRMLMKKGFQLNQPAGRKAAGEFLIAQLARMLREQAGYAETLDAARRLGNPTEEFAARSTLYRERGLSLDTSLSPNLAIERSLAELQRRGVLARGGVKRVAVVGPGLDFTDKQSGFDFYPQQSVQPFAVMDTLLRLGLAHAEQLTVTTFDISPRVNDHLSRAVERARRGASYVLQLPFDPSVSWTPELREYWTNFGGRAGTRATAAALPAALKHLAMRAVRIRPGMVTKLRVRDLNIVLARPGLAANEKFDLIIATNILVYYDSFEQSLAMVNIEQMLRPGGIFLCNNALLELPFSRVHSIGYLTTQYSERADDGDHIVWYQRQEVRK